LVGERVAARFNREGEEREVGSDDDAVAWDRTFDDVSLAILNLNLDSATDRDQLNAHLRHMSLHSDLRRQIVYTDSPEVVSSDFLDSRHTGIIDGLATVSAGTNAVVYVWYDECGYSCQVIRVMEEMANAQRPAFPARQRQVTAV
jgi:glyceraldehyde 3-phosphate dehydrogenase